LSRNPGSAQVNHQFANRHSQLNRVQQGNDVEYGDEYSDEESEEEEDEDEVDQSAVAARRNAAQVSSMILDFEY